MVFQKGSIQMLSIALPLPSIEIFTLCFSTELPDYAPLSGKSPSEFPRDLFFLFIKKINELCLSTTLSMKLKNINKSLQSYKNNLFSIIFKVDENLIVQEK